MSPAGPLAGKIAVVTGAARGVGTAIAARLAEQGTDLMLFDLDGDALAVYAAAKAAVAGFSRSLAKEVAAQGITVNCVSTSTTLTPGAHATFTDEQLAKMPRRYPVGRLGEPDDAANAVSYFVSPNSSWVTGQTLSVNGGYAMF